METGDIISTIWILTFLLQGSAASGMDKSKRKQRDLGGLPGGRDIPPGLDKGGGAPPGRTFWTEKTAGAHASGA